MQNLPVTAVSPVAPAQAPSSADSAPQATEPFSNVLARQRANATESKPADGRQSQPGSKQDAAPAPGDASSATDGKGAQDAAQGAGGTVAGVMSGDLLAALLPGVVTVTDKTAGDKPAAQAATPDAAGTLPGDVLAMLLPAQAAAKGAADVSEKGAREVMAGGDKKARPQQLEAAGFGKAQPGQIKGEAASGAGPVRGQGGGKAEPAVEAAGMNKDKAFAAMLETSVKGGAKAISSVADQAKANPQQDAAAVQVGGAVANAAVSATGSTNAMPAAQAVINTPVADAAWGGEFNQKITWMATQQQQTAELHLNPPNLGPLDVVLNVNGDQATALFSSPHAAVREAVEQALPRLRDMMADNGIMLGNATVSDQSPRDQQAGQSPGQRDGGQASGRVDATLATGAVPVGTTIPMRRHLGMVDTFV